MPLFHWTCNHGQTGIVKDGFRVRTPATRLSPLVLDHAQASLQGMSWTLFVSWFTDLDTPHAEALGLIGRPECDRTEHRFRVRDEAEIQSWPEFARQAPRQMREAVESLPGAMPAHWLVTVAAAVPVAYVPVQEGGRLWTPR